MATVFTLNVELGYHPKEVSETGLSKLGDDGTYWDWYSSGMNTRLILIFGLYFRALS